MIYKLMKNKILKANLSNEDEVTKLQEMLDTFLAGERITIDEYKDLSSMLK